MPELFKDNPYPLLMFHSTLEPTNALDEKGAAELRRKGYVENYQFKEYPRHVPTGEKRKVMNDDGGFTEVPVTKIVHTKAEHDALLAELNLSEDEPVKRGPGRPRKEEPVVA